MSEYTPLTTNAELDLLDMDACVEGYRAGIHGDPEPGSDKCKSFWHGWRNGMMDTNRMPHDADARALAGAFIKAQRAH